MNTTFSQSRETILENSIEALKQNLAKSLSVSDRWGVAVDIRLRPQEDGRMALQVTFEHNKQVTTINVEADTVQKYSQDVVSLAQNLADRAYEALIRPNLVEALRSLPIAVENISRINSGRGAL